MDEANTPGERGDDPDNRLEPAHDTALTLTDPFVSPSLTKSDADLLDGL